MKARPTLRKLLGLLLSLVLMAGVLPTTVFAAGMPFTDVKKDAWYYNDVKSVYESELINGKSATAFEPDANLTYAEAVKLAACMHQKSTVGSVTLKNGDPWYQSYADYCRQNGIISKDYNWNEKATRAGYMEIFSGALPEDSLKATNSVADGAIPDVPANHPQAAAIYKLYRAGILRGVDKEFRCNPDANIKRCEVATILTRMMNEEGRLTFTIGAEMVAPLQIVTQPESYQMTSNSETVTLSVEIFGGTAPYDYCWRIYGDVINETKHDISSSKISNADFLLSSSDFDGYRQICVVCDITDAEGSEIHSKEVMIRPYIPAGAALEIAEQPESYQMKSATESATFSIEMTGGVAPYEYRWLAYYIASDGQMLDEQEYTDISEKETSSAAFAIQDYDSDADYRITVVCFIRDAKGSVACSDEVAINPCAAVSNSLKIITQPKDVTVEEGAQAELTVAVTGGTAPYTYEWQTYNQDRWANLKAMGYHFDSDDNTICLTASKKTWTTDGPIRCIITDAAGNTVTSDSANVSVNANPPIITTQPKDVTVEEGAQAELTVAVTGGTAPYTYEWQTYNQDRWANLKAMGYHFDSDDNTICLTASKKTWTTDGPIRCIITDATGNSVTSDSVKVSVNELPLTITTQPQNVTTTNGGRVELTVAVTGGTAPYTYEWQVNTRSVWLTLHDGDWSCDLDGNKIYLTASGKTWASGGAIRCIITDADGNSVTSKGALITVK